MGTKTERVLLIAVALGGIAILVLSRQKTLAAKTPVQAFFVDSTGSYVKSIDYLVGDMMQVSVQVPQTSKPVSVQAFIAGKAGATHEWNTQLTGSNYILNFGAAPNQPGTYSVYALVTFADGSSSKSDRILAKISTLSEILPYDPYSAESIAAFDRTQKELF